MRKEKKQQKDRWSKNKKYLDGIKNGRRQIRLAFGTDINHEVYKYYKSYIGVIYMSQDSHFRWQSAFTSSVSAACDIKHFSYWNRFTCFFYKLKRLRVCTMLECSVYNICFIEQKYYEPVTVLLGGFNFFLNKCVY